MSVARITELLENTGNTSTVTITRPNDTTAYAIGDVVGQSPAANLVFTGVSSRSGGTIIVKDVHLLVAVGSIPTGMSSFYLHFFTSAPTAIADNTAFNIIAADRSKYRGFIEIQAPVDMGDTLWSENIGVNKQIDLAVGSTTLYGVLTTSAIFTPTAQSVKNIILQTLEV
jgi:hypothetical protein